MKKRASTQASMPAPTAASVLEETLMRKPAVLAALGGISHSNLYGLIRRGEFEPPIKVTERVSAWPASAVRKFIEDRIRASRDPKCSPRRIPAVGEYSEMPGSERGNTPMGAQ